MAFIPNPDTVKVAVEYLLDSQEVANIYHVDVGATITSVIINAILDEFVDWLTVEIMPLLSDDLHVTAVTGRDVSTVSGMFIERPITPTIDGSVTGGALPNNVAICGTWLTDQSGRSYRGRSYFPGLAESDVQASYLDTPDAAALAVAMVELVNMIDGIGYDLVVASYQTANAPRVTAVNTPIIAAGVNTVVDSQRRRLPGRGT